MKLCKYIWLKSITDCITRYLFICYPLYGCILCRMYLSQYWGATNDATEEKNFYNSHRKLGTLVSNHLYNSIFEKIILTVGELKDLTLHRANVVKLPWLRAVSASQEWILSIVKWVHFFLGPWLLVCQLREISNQMESNGEV